MAQSITPRSDLLGVQAGLGLEGGGSVGVVPVSMETPVSLLNGGTGLSAFTNAQLLSGIGAFPRTGGHMSGDLTVVNGVVVGDPIDGNLGTGTINVQSIVQVNASTAPASALPPGTHLHVESDDVGARILLTGWAGDATLQMRSASGTGGTPGAVPDNGLLGILAFGGYTPGGWATAPQRRAGVEARASQPWTNTANGCVLEFETTANDAAVPQVRMRVAQGLSVGNPTAIPTGDAPGSINAQSIYVNGVAVGTGGSGLPLSGGTLSGTQDLLTLQTAAGNRNWLTFDQPSPINQQWSVGAGTSGNFTVVNVTSAAPAILTIDRTTGDVHLTNDLDVDGDIVAGSVTPSDRRLKRNMAPWRRGLNEVRLLNPIRFEYSGVGGRKADGRVRVGLDADDTQQVIPEMVGVRRIGEIDDAKTIRPDTLTFALINAVKELAGRLEAIEARLG